MAPSSISGDYIYPVLTDTWSDWQTLLNDPGANTTVKYIKGFANKCGIPSEQLFRDASSLPFDAKKGVPRAVCWLTAGECACPYTYGTHNPVVCKAGDFAIWLFALTKAIQSVTGLALEFDCCNANRYSTGMQACGWHSDHEALFRHKDGFDIVSLSIGVSRYFELQKISSGAFKRILLDDGDLLWMAGDCQRYYKHRIPIEPHTDGIRINLTWRHIHKHVARCALHRI